MRLANQFKNVIQHQKNTNQLLRNVREVNRLSTHLRVANGGAVTTSQDAHKIKVAKSLKVNRGLVVPRAVSKEDAKNAYKKLS